MPNGLLDNAEIGIPCPECGHETKKSLGWLKQHSEFPCTGCKRVIQFDRDKLIREVRKVDSAVDAFKRAIDRINKR